MADEHAVLTVSEAQAYYNRFGKKQDSQGFYEDPVLDDLIAHASFQEAQRVFEFGCGTGKFAARLLAEYLPASATYLGCDVSPVMIGLAAQRLEAYSEQATVLPSNGTVHFPLSDHSADRLISSYVLDLLSDGDIRALFAEAHRVLMPGGRLCLASLTNWITLADNLLDDPVSDRRDPQQTDAGAFGLGDLDPTHRLRRLLAPQLMPIVMCLSWLNDPTGSSLAAEVNTMGEIIFTKDPDILGGTMVFVGTRVPVRILFEHLEAGDRLEEFLEDFPTVSKTQAVRAIELAAQRLNQMTDEAAA